MERLTMFFMNKNICNASGEVCEQQIKNPKDPNCCCDCEINKKMIDKLAEYEDAEEQGLLLRLPCKVGTNIYIVNHWWIDEGHICGISECDDTDCACFKVYEDPDTYTIVAFDEFGETWFLTREEAEAALKKMQEGKK